MRVTFYSNFLNHHQLPFCEEMLARLGDDFAFVACERLPGDRAALGYTDMNESHGFVVRAYESTAAYATARQLALDSDAVIIGHAPREFIEQRMSANRLTFRYAERPFKRGPYRRFIPSTRWKIYNGYTRYRKGPFYVLCASAYTAPDLTLCGFPTEKCLRWGYFPETVVHDLGSLLAPKGRGVPRMVWAGRMLDWKHPEHAVEVARRLNADGYQFVLDLIGTGPEENRLRERVDRLGLTGCVHLHGAMSPSLVRRHMEAASVHLCTSSFQEGWGAVVNEAMNSACAVVASHATGCVPFLLRHGENGLVYRFGDAEGLYSNVRWLLEDRERCAPLGVQAYKTITSAWTPSVAASRFLAIARGLMAKGEVFFGDGPCSLAPALRDDWFGGASADQAPPSTVGSS